MMEQIYLRCFGNPQLFLGDQELSLNRRKGLALVIYLALTNRKHTRNALATLLWSESSQSGALSALRTTLRDLRKTPLEPYFVLEQDTIALTNIKSDVMIFRDMMEKLDQQAISPRHHEQGIECVTQALDLFQESFLAGFTLTACEGFERWQQLEGQQLATRQLDAIRFVTDYHIQMQETDTAIEYIQQHIALDPFDEVPYRTLMTIYAATGRKGLALQLYETLNSLLADELDVSPDEASQELYEAILNDADITPITKKSVIMPPIPRGQWVGREDVFKDILSQMQQGCETIVIQGTPGIGKTSLVRKIAHAPEIEKLFPDGVLWATAGEAPNPLSELTLWYTVLGKSVTIDLSLPLLMRHLTTLLQKKRMLLIVDDVWREQDFVPFRLGGSKCVHLVTTRQYDVAMKIKDPRYDVIKLAGLDEQQSFQLFQYLAPAVSNQYEYDVKSLLCQLGNAPLAIRVVSRLLNYEASLGWNLTDILQSLGNDCSLFNTPIPSEDTHSLETISGLFERSIHQLDPQIQTYFLELAVMALDARGFDQDVFSALWGVTDARPILRQLVNHGLLEAVGHGQFVIHALLHKYTQSGASIDLSPAMKRHTDYYLNLLRQADQLYAYHPDALLDALQMVDKMLPQLRHIQSRLLHHPTHAIDYIGVGHDLLKLRLLPSELLKWYTDCLKLIQNTVAEDAIGECLYYIGTTASMAMKPDQALDALEQSIRIATATENHHLEARAIQQLGELHLLVNDYVLAQQDFEYSLELWQQLHNQRGIAQCLNKLGKVAWRCGDYIKARDHHLESLAMWQTIGDRSGIAECVSYLGNVYGILGDNARSKSYHLQSLEMRRALSDERGIGEALNNLGAVSWREGEFQKASQYYRESLEIRQRMEDVPGVALTLINLGRVALQEQYLHVARSYFERGRNLCKTSDIKHWHSYALGKLGKIAFLEGNHQAALMCLREALQIANRVHSRGLHLEILAGFAVVFESMGQVTISGMIQHTIAHYQDAIYDETRQMLYDYFADWYASTATDVMTLDACMDWVLSLVEPQQDYQTLRVQSNEISLSLSIENNMMKATSAST